MSSDSKLKPNPEVLNAPIHELFVEYSTAYFEGIVHNSACMVEWSKRMTLCAGITYEHKNGQCTIRLSLPLLQYLPLKELKETLLHEMIHAYLFITKKQTYLDYQNGGHGPVFFK